MVWRREVGIGAEQVMKALCAIVRTLASTVSEVHVIILI